MLPCGAHYDHYLLEAFAGISIFLGCCAILVGRDIVTKYRIESRITKRLLLNILTLFVLCGGLIDFILHQSLQAKNLNVFYKNNFSRMYSIEKSWDRLANLLFLPDDTVVLVKSFPLKEYYTY